RVLLERLEPVGGHNLAIVSAGVEARRSFDCFGSSCEVLVQGDAPGRSGGDAADLARRRLQEWHNQFSRFLPDSELSLLNANPRRTVVVSQLMVRLAEAVLL